MLECPIHERFDMIFGTSTGSIITAMLALGKTVPEIIELYKEHVPTVMKHKNAHGRSGALAKLAETIFGDAMFADVKTSVGIVTTKWIIEKPMIFKTHLGQAHGMKGSFVPVSGSESEMRSRRRVPHTHTSTARPSPRPTATTSN